MNWILAIICSVLIAFILMAVLVMTTVSLLGVIFPTQYGPKLRGAPSAFWVILNIIYGSCYALVGGYICVNLALYFSSDDVTVANKAAVVLPSFLLFMNLLTVAITPEYDPKTAESPMQYQPLYYKIIHPITAVGCCYYGALQALQY